ncbi:Gfo/Idh/MocA family oxidoreductase [uncultured Ruegeria sp.]|uniref:Gfo/Idh/MocA family protein n=1 Tax=uncultured Ruegeria sp. TaxID=259304 RepID=UPI0026147B0B|nr:Gfo/Idh/MocA family oxidoreductase [uncultured Ruegeria sp.]
MTKSFGVIGLGRMGFRTVLAGRAAGLELTKILDSSDSPWGVSQEPKLASTMVNSLNAFLAEPPDIVSISTTADSHAELFRALAAAGVKAILVEKPVACSVDDGLEMARIAEEYGIKAVVNHNHRCWNVLQRIRAFDGTPQFGRMQSFIITQGAGGLGNLGTHYFDLANWMFSDTPQYVAAVGTTPEAPNPRGEQFKDVGGAVLVGYSEQRRLMLEIGDDIGVIGGYEIRFERGRVLMPFTSEPPKVYVRRPDAQDLPKHFYGAALDELPWEGFVPGDVVANTREVFFDLVKGRNDGGATLTEATAALEVMIAARKAIETRTGVVLPLGAADRRKIYSLA